MAKTRAPIMAPSVKRPNAVPATLVPDTPVKRSGLKKATQKLK